MRKRRVGGYEGKRVRDAATLLPSYPPTLLRRLRSALKQITGMPDYTRYLEHAREYHPDCPLLSEREYYDQYIESRYQGGGSRCC
jgi:uncharacterized short protein YbdD (DUF466 family)